MLEKRYDEDKTKPKHEDLNTNKIEPFIVQMDQTL
jgi:hypothetical protein